MINFSEWAKDRTNDVPPNGNYIAKISKGEFANTKAGTGMFFKVTFSIMNQPYVGYKIFNYYNIQNDNPIAEDIGKRELGKLILSVAKDLQIEKIEELEHAILGLCCKIYVEKEDKFLKIKKVEPVSIEEVKKLDITYTGKAVKEQKYVLEEIPFWNLEITR